MTGRKKQQGLTLLGFVMVLAVVGVFAFVGLKLFPVYSEYYSVVSDMKGIQAEPGVSSKSPAEIKKLLFRRFYVSYVESVKQENITVTRQNGYNLRETGVNAIQDGAFTLGHAFDIYRRARERGLDIDLFPRRAS